MHHRTYRWAVLLMACASSALASAHVTVWPRAATQGSFEKYTVRVPTEGQVATTSIELAMPEGFTFVAIGAAVGHAYELKRASGRVVGIVWSMKINPGEFAEFSFMGRNPRDAKELVWKAVQRFSDGTSAEWVGGPGNSYPASVTTLSPPARTGH